MIPLALCEKLLLLAGGEQIPASKLKHAIIDELTEEGIIAARITGRTKSILYITDAKALDAWLYNRHSINNLADYIQHLRNEAATRADMVLAGNDSKIRRLRTYKGFLVNSYTPISCNLNGEPYLIYPAPGTFQFIYDYEHFIPADNVTIVGVENMENFRFIERQASLFTYITPLFVCRYPQEQSRDLIKWLLSIPNPYLHFGDYDFAGISIYLREYKAHLHGRASFFIPAHLEELLAKHGNRKLYDQQQPGHEEITEPGLEKLVSLLHQYKKGLEQEAFLL